MTRTQRQIEAYRQSDAIVLLRRAGFPVWVEQETHEFRFGCAARPPDDLSAADRERYRARLEDLFNDLAPREIDAGLQVCDPISLGALRARLDQQASLGQPFDVHVCGRTVQMSELAESESARRVAEIYTLCFAHPAVQGIIWHGFRDGDSDATDGGLLRHDLSPKPAYRVLQKLVEIVWHSRAAGLTDAAGAFPFRGFRGRYRVGVADGTATPRVSSFPLARQEQPAVPVVIELD